MQLSDAHFSDKIEQLCRKREAGGGGVGGSHQRRMKLSASENNVYNNNQGRRKHLKLGGTRHSEGTSSLRKRGYFLKIVRALVCSMQNLGGTGPSALPPAHKSMRTTRAIGHTITSRLCFPIHFIINDTPAIELYLKCLKKHFCKQDRGNSIRDGKHLNLNVDIV